MSDTELPPNPPVEPTPAWADTQLAKKEEKNWPDEDALKGVKMRNDIWWHTVYGLAIVFLMVVLVLSFAGALIVWVLHHITPICFLTPDQLSKIQSVIFSGSLGAIVSTYMQKRLTEK